MNPNTVKYRFAFIRGKKEWLFMDSRPISPLPPAWPVGCGERRARERPARTASLASGSWIRFAAGQASIDAIRAPS